MPVGGRKKPFSGKQKKQQLQTKRDKQHSRENGGGSESEPHHSGTFPTSAEEGRPSQAKASSSDSRAQHRNEFTASLEEASSVGSKFFEVRHPTSKADAGRYALIFRKESKEEVYRQRKEGRKTLHPVLEEYLECKIEDFFSPELDFPIRPPWNYELTREQVERNEQRYFHEYLKRIDTKYERTDLSYFELNLETWRQLWRVFEMSDIVLYVVDIRYPALLFPPKLYDYVCSELGKRIILVLNKIDICPAPLVLAWLDYFKQKYPGLEVISFTSYPSYNLYGNEGTTSLQGRKRRGRMKMAAEGALELYKVCAELVQGEVDLTTWKKKIQEEVNAADEIVEDVKVEIDKVVIEKADSGFYSFSKFTGGILTIGCVGQPNVGKSSLINALMGKKVVSVSRTPGHTKHFQTIFLTPNVRLCDCPGLIFPSKIPKALQVLCGSFPIAQLREPYTTVKYLGERLDLPKILKISHPEGDEEWSACDIADGWAAKRGYYTAKAARLDTYRGANHILRLALEGRICFCLYPPDYCSKKDEWSKDDRVLQIRSIQAQAQNTSVAHHEINSSEEDDSDDELHGSEEVVQAERASSDESDHEESAAKAGTKPVKVATAVSMKNKFALLGENDDVTDDCDE